ncbi:unnamed protein product, partial [Effrenium voratum]
PSEHCLVTLEGPRRRYEHSIHYLESAKSFNSMTCKKANTSHACGPDAATHKRHLKKLQNFMDILPDQESGLRKEILLRRLSMLKRACVMELEEASRA